MYCLKRGDFYYFRMRVPADLIPILGHREFTKSLRTKDGNVAKALSAALSARIQNAILQTRLSRLQGNDVSQLRVLASALLSEGDDSEAIARSTTVSQLIESYLDDRSRSWNLKTLELNRAALRTFYKLVGDKGIDELTRADCRNYRDLLIDLPKNSFRYSSSHSFTQLKKINGPRLDPKTINRNLIFLSTMMNWAMKEGLLLSNPAIGLSLPILRMPSDERRAFSNQELELLFKALNDDKLEDRQRWIPKIALYSGMRLEEIAQLRIRDIECQDGTYLFRISPDAGLIKTKNAARLVPIHSSLINGGLLSLVTARKEQHDDRLWPILLPDKYGRRSSPISKWFSRYLRKLGIEDRRVTFHSLRHTFINALKQNDVSEPIIRAIVGHVEQSLTLGRYGKGYSVKKLHAAIEHLEF